MLIRNESNIWDTSGAGAGVTLGFIFSNLDTRFNVYIPVHIPILQNARLISTFFPLTTPT